MVVLAVDMPRVTPHTLRRLRLATAGHDGSALVDATGRRQLAMALDVGALRAAASTYQAWHGLPLRDLLPRWTWSRSPPPATRAATWTRGPTCATSGVDRTTSACGGLVR